jgi:hypothetical protein
MSQVYRAIDLEREHGEAAVKVMPAPRQQFRCAVRAFDLECPHPESHSTLRTASWIARNARTLPDAVLRRGRPPCRPGLNLTLAVCWNWSVAMFCVSSWEKVLPLVWP